MSDDLQPAFEPATKRSLLVVSHAMERAFDTVSDAADSRSPGLVIGLFQRREYFDIEAERYGMLASAGHTVVVGFVGPLDGLPPGVEGVSFREDDPRASIWALMCVRGPYATALVAEDRRDLSAGEMTLEASRVFAARWTFQRQLALDDARAHLDSLADDVAPVVFDAASAHLDRSRALPVSSVEARLAAAADHLVASVDAGQRRVTRLRLALETTQSLAERDQLTGLNNRHYLERYLGDGDRPADLMTMLVDVDRLKQINDENGHGAGDAALSAVAATLVQHIRPGDVLVRWGGDEFLVLVPGLKAVDGLAFGERLAEAVQAAHPEPPWEHLSLSVSIGVCPARRTLLPLDRLDEALYLVKQSGRGRAALAPEIVRTAPVAGVAALN